MTIDLPPTCRVCGRNGRVRLATYVRNDDEVQNWYLCDDHTQLVAKYMNPALLGLTQLPDAIESRRKNKEAAKLPR